MVAKILVFVALFGAAVAHSAFSSQHVRKFEGHQEQSSHQRHGWMDSHQRQNYQEHPKYEFEYNVEDSHTGDQKSQHESRDGDVVHGHYWLQQPDGSIRDVHYHDDGQSGFHADVKYSTNHVVPQHHNNYY